MLNACIHKLIYWLIRNHLQSKGYEENEVFRITAANRPSFTIFKMMYSVTSFGFGWFLNLGLFLGLTYDLSVYVAPRMSKHYLKQCFIRYFNMQFSKNNVVSDFGIIKLRWMLAFISCFIVSKALAACQWATSSAWSFDHIFNLWVLTHSGDKGIRTLDPLLARQVLSQLSYTPIKLLLSKNQNVL